MTNYCMKLVLERWIHPHMDTSAWEYYDLSCKNRDDTEDKVGAPAGQACADHVELGPIICSVVGLV